MRLSIIVVNTFLFAGMFCAAKLQAQGDEDAVRTPAGTARNPAEKKQKRTGARGSRTPNVLLQPPNSEGASPATAITTTSAAPPQVRVPASAFSATSSGSSNSTGDKDSAHAAIDSFQGVRWTESTGFVVAKGSSGAESVPEGFVAPLIRPVGYHNVLLVGVSTGFTQLLPSHASVPSSASMRAFTLGLQVQLDWRTPVSPFIPRVTASVPLAIADKTSDAYYSDGKASVKALPLSVGAGIDWRPRPFLAFGPEIGASLLYASYTLTGSREVGVSTTPVDESTSGTDFGIRYGVHALVMLPDGDLRPSRLRFDANAFQERSRYLTGTYARVGVIVDVGRRIYLNVYGQERLWVNGTYSASPAASSDATTRGTAFAYGQPVQTVTGIAVGGLFY